MASGSTLSGDTALRRPAATVVYLGAEEARSDAAFLKFQAAMQRWALPGSAPYTLRYHRLASTAPSRMVQEVADVLAQRPDIVIAPTGARALATARQRGGTQVVFASHPDPVHYGIVESAKHPGHGLTGVSQADDVHAKRLELIRDAYPQTRTVAVLADRSWWRDFHGRAAFEQAAAAQGLLLQAVLADSVEELSEAMRSFHAKQSPAPDAWYIPATYLAYTAEAAILAHLQRLGRPSMHTTLGEVARGAPMAYVQDTGFVFDALADLAHRVLRGVDAGSIPVQGPRQFILAVRPREAPAALRMHPSVIRRADRVY